MKTFFKDAPQDESDENPLLDKASPIEHGAPQDSQPGLPLKHPHRRVMFVLVVVGLLMVGALFYNSYVTNLKLDTLSMELHSQQRVAAATAQAGAQPAQPDLNDPQNITLKDGAPMMGSADAPVTVVEYADYQCPFCEKFFTEVAPQLKTNYIDTGKVKFYFQDFAFLGQESNDAAEAAKCAGDQNKYWEFHDYLYNHQTGENQGGFKPDNLKKFAVTLKLDTKKFNQCMDSHQFQQAVTDETAAGQGYGVSGTPTTFINGNRVVGAQPFSAVQDEIEKALAAQQ